VRIGVMILSLAIFSITLVLTYNVSISSDYEDNDPIAEEIAIGTALSFAFLIGGVFALKVPSVTAAVLAFAGFFALISRPDVHLDLPFLGGIAVILASCALWSDQMEKTRIREETDLSQPEKADKKELDLEVRDEDLKLSSNETKIVMNDSTTWECSKCHHIQKNTPDELQRLNYCPGCGRKIMQIIRRNTASQNKKQDGDSQI